MSFNSKEEIVDEMLRRARVYGLEYEVLRTFNTYVRNLLKEPTLSDYEREAACALYEWDI